jgi:hypothetical protein
MLRGRVHHVSGLQAAPRRTPPALLYAWRHAVARVQGFRQRPQWRRDRDMHWYC